MKITQVSYRRVFNLGNYETATVEIECIDQLALKAHQWRNRKEAKQ